MVASALVLNTTYEPLCVVPQRRAAVLILTDKAVPVCQGGGLFRSEKVRLLAPTVVRLTRFVRVPYRGAIALTRRGVFTRDSGRCAYCGAAATTIDHVIPRSRGGSHAWENVVAACTKCNHRKADRTLGELGWRLPRQPKAPVGLTARILGHRSPEPGWLDWFGSPEPALA
ncbi:MAG: HNH endonuclease [Corynebacteriales bacterium]|nr:HNH endonuclease [Mycobacteriales bacterium]